MSTETQGAGAEPVVTTTTPASTENASQATAEVKTPEAATEGENQDGATTDENAEKPKKADGGFQRRINRLTADFRAAEAKAYAAEQKARELEAKLTAPTTSASDDTKPPRLEDFRSYEEYERADRQYVADKATRDAEKRFKQAEAERATNETRQAENKRHAEARKRFEDAADKVSEHYEDFADVMDDMWRDRVPVISRNPAVAAYIIEESDRGPEIAYHLANNQADAERIAKLSPLGQVKELVKLEASLPKPNAKATQAPQPPRNLGSRGGSDTKDPSKMTIDEMRKATGTQRKVRSDY